MKYYIKDNRMDGYDRMDFFVLHPIEKIFSMFKECEAM